MNKYVNIIYYEASLFHLIKLNNQKETNDFLDFFIKKHNINKLTENCLKSHDLNISFNIPSAHTDIYKNENVITLTCKKCQLDDSIVQLWHESLKNFINTSKIKYFSNNILSCDEQIIKNILE